MQDFTSRSHTLLEKVLKKKPAVTWKDLQDDLKAAEATVTTVSNKQHHSPLHF